MSTSLPQGEIHELAHARCAPYAFLSRLLRSEVDEEFLQSLTLQAHCYASMHISNPTQHMPPENEACIFSFLRQRLVDTCTMQDILNELRTDYCRLFLLGVSSIHPYESAYTSENGLLMQGAYHDARRSYASAGFAQSESSQEMLDHIALELEFMSRTSAQLHETLLSENHAEAQRILAIQQRFLDVHLRWVDRFSHDMITHAHTDFYRGAAQLLQAIVTSDRQNLSIIADFLAEAKK